VQYIDCGAGFLVNDPARPGGRVIDLRLVPDGVHPSAAGMDVLGLCLDPTVAFLKSHPRAGVQKKDIVQVRHEASQQRKKLYLKELQQHSCEVIRSEGRAILYAVGEAATSASTNWYLCLRYAVMRMQAHTSVVCCASVVQQAR